MEGVSLEVEALLIDILGEVGVVSDDGGEVYWVSAEDGEVIMMRWAKADGRPANRFASIVG